MLDQILLCIVSDDNLHARWLNTLSYLEYVGARKILKSQSENDIDLDLLEHMAEELHHALFLKRLLKKNFLPVTKTFAVKDLLAKTASKSYIQTVDALCAKRATNPRHAYLLSSYVIETRALTLYGSYQQHVPQLRLASILNQEQRHLFRMKELLCREGNFFAVEQELIAEEADCFTSWMRSLKEEIKHYDPNAF